MYKLRLDINSVESRVLSAENNHSGCTSPRTGKFEDPMLQWRDPVHDPPASPGSSSAALSLNRCMSPRHDHFSPKQKTFLYSLEPRRSNPGVLLPSTLETTDRELCIERRHSHTSIPAPTSHSPEEIEEARRVISFTSSSSSLKGRLKGPLSPGQHLQSRTHEAVKQLSPTASVAPQAVYDVVH